MNLPTTYLLNVALHAGVLSIFAALLTAFLRLPQQRSFVAIAGLLVVGFLPWITALRPAPAPRALPAITEVRATPPPAEMPLWTIVTVPVRNEASEPLVPPVATAAEWELPDFPTCLMALWAAGTGLGLAFFAIAWVKVMVWKMSLTRPDDAAWQKLHGLAPDHLSKGDFLICPYDASPCVIGFWRTRIVIPRFLLGQSPENLGWAVRHEIAHHQAGDSRWMMFFTVILCMNWWNPLVHRLITVWADAREQLCDLHASPLADNRADYGEFLITMARNIGKQPPLAVAMAKRLHARRLKQRIVSLLESRSDAAKPVGKGFACLSSALFVVIVMGVSALKIGAEEIQNLSDKKTEGEAIPIVSTEAVPEQPVQPSPSPGPAVAAEPEPFGKADHIQTKRQTKTSTRFIITDYNPGFDAEPVRDGGEFTRISMFSDAQVALIMRSFSSKRGTDLLTLPSITALSGQVGTIEVTKPVLGTAEQIAKRGDGEVPFMGIRFTPVSRFTEENPPSNGYIELNLALDYRFIPGIDASSAASENKSSEGLNPEEIKVFKKTVHGNLFSGYTLGVVLGEIEPGKYLSVFTKVEILDKTGRVIDFQKIFEESAILKDRQRRTEEGTFPYPEIPGSLRLSATLVDLPLNKPRPPGEGLVIGLTPSAPSVADQIKKTPGGKVRELKTVEIPLNQRITPWPEFPGLSLTALASKNHQVISLTSHAIGTGENEFPNTWEQAPGDVMNFGIRTKDKSVERRLLITIEGVK